jgi:hypothetical protein
LFKRRVDDDEISLVIVNFQVLMRHSDDLRERRQRKWNLMHKIINVSRVTLHHAPCTTQIVANSTRQ